MVWFYDPSLFAISDIAVDPNADVSFDELDVSEEGLELTFAYGPLPDDVIGAADLLANILEDDIEPDEFQYNFSFTLQDDVVALNELIGQSLDDLESNEDAIELELFQGPLSDNLIELIGASNEDADNDDIEYDFAASPLADDVFAATDALINIFDEGQPPEEFDHDFTFTLLEDAQIYAAHFDDDTSIDESDHSFSFAPLSDNFVAAVEPQYQSFEDYADDDFYEYSFYLGIVGEDGVPPRKLTGSRGGFGAPCVTRPMTPNSKRTNRQAAGI